MPESLAASETICAPATAPGRSALALVRVSGPAVRELARARAGRALEPRRATLVEWRALDGSLLDQAVAVFFPGPRSYTGEDLLELSLHGNPQLVREVLADLHEAGIRLAGPGEFTLRAVRSGRLDLARAESVAALIEAETGPALRAAREVLAGGLAREIAALREGLLDLSMRLELATDFAEEEAVPDGSALLPAARAARSRLEALLSAQERVQAASRAPRVVLAGRPNAGKSSLVNALLGEDRLVVSSLPGTTRDWVEVPVPTPRGVVHLCDTAGLAEARDTLDALAQERTRELIARSGLRLLLVEAGREPGPDEQAWIEQGGWRVVRSKLDLCPDWPLPAGQGGLSVATGEGLESLREELGRLVHDDPALERRETVALVGERQRALANQARSELIELETRLEKGEIEIGAWHLRQAVSRLEDLVGGVAPQEVLERVFSSFCIGK